MSFSKLILNVSFFPKHQDNRMKNVGDTISARKLFRKVFDLGRKIVLENFSVIRFIKI
mgnify:CR=1 FL=1